MFGISSFGAHLCNWDSNSTFCFLRGGVGATPEAHCPPVSTESGRAHSAIIQAKNIQGGKSHMNQGIKRKCHIPLFFPRSFYHFDPLCEFEWQILGPAKWLQGISQSLSLSSLLSLQWSPWRVNTFISNLTTKNCEKPMFSALWFSILMTPYPTQTTPCAIHTLQVKSKPCFNRSQRKGILHNSAHVHTLTLHFPPATET